MKTSDRFNNAISALVKSFFNETLAKGDCNACAVGNMCAAGLGITTSLSTNCGIEANGRWKSVFCTEEDGVQNINPYNYEGEAKRAIDSTNYSWKELAKIEKAFEMATKIPIEKYEYRTKDDIIQDQYNGLMAVVEVLCKIEGIDTAETKEMFSYRIEENKPVIA